MSKHRWRASLKPARTAPRYLGSAMCRVRDIQRYETAVFGKLNIGITKVIRVTRHELLGCATHRLLVVALMFSSALMCHSQTSSKQPNELYTRGLNALTGSSQSVSILTGLDLIRRSAESGYGPAQASLGYIEETGYQLRRMHSSRPHGTRRLPSREIPWQLGLWGGCISPVLFLTELRVKNGFGKRQMPEIHSEHIFWLNLYRPVIGAVQRSIIARRWSRVFLSASTGLASCCAMGLASLWTSSPHTCGCYLVNRPALRRQVWRSKHLKRSSAVRTLKKGRQQLVTLSHRFCVHAMRMGVRAGRVNSI